MQLYVFVCTDTRSPPFFLSLSLCVCCNKSSKHKIRKHLNGELFTTISGKCAANAIPATFWRETRVTRFIYLLAILCEWAGGQASNRTISNCYVSAALTQQVDSLAFFGRAKPPPPKLFSLNCEKQQRIHSLARLLGVCVALYCCCVWRINRKI